MENDLEMMLLSDFLHQDHQHHVLVYGRYSVAEDWSAFKLIRGDLVVPCLKEDPEFVCLRLKILHECADFRRNGSEIMVFELLVLR